MSGGHWNYQNDYLCDEILGVGADYGLDSKERKEDILQVRKLNLLEDKVISEIVYDVFCLLHSYDWYRSGDTCEETYRKDVDTFKKKWLKQNNKYTKEFIENEFESFKNDLIRDLRLGK